MTSPTLIPTPEQRAHDSLIDSGSQAIAIATTAQGVATAAQSIAQDAYSNSTEAISAVGVTQVEAAEDIYAFAPVTADGHICDCHNSAHYGHLVGLSESPVSQGFMVNLRRTGVITNLTWSWTPLATIFCGAGGLTMTPGEGMWSQAIGIAKDETSLLISFGEPILL